MMDLIAFFDPGLASMAGKAAFILVFVVLFVGLVIVPQKTDGFSEPKELWKRPRTWAMAVVFVQILIYLIWG